MNDAGPKKPKLESVSPHQWYAVNCRIMYKLIINGDLIWKAISDYLGYTVKIAQLAERYVWTTVLHYDRQYRQLQSVFGFAWGSDCHHLTKVFLREKISPSLPHVTPHQNLSKMPQLTPALISKRAWNSIAPPAVFAQLADLFMFASNALSRILSPTIPSNRTSEQLLGQP